MSLFVLDTDHLSLLQRAHPVVLRRVASHPAEAIAITIVTAEEQLRGWLAVIRRHNATERQVWAYGGLRDALSMFERFTILDFDHVAYERFAEVRRARYSIGSQDLRIAAIVLAVGATLVTRNRRDFGQIPGRTIEDWSTGAPSPRSNG